MKANLATLLIAYARGGVRKQLLVLCLLTLCVGNMWGGASWIGKSYIVVNGTWYNADGTGQSNNFDGYKLGHLTSLTLGGEVQTYGQSDGYDNSATMGYQISGQSASSMTLYWYQYKENNNWFHSASGKSSDFAANKINISGLTPGEYTLSVWFYQADGGVYDSNSNNNYVATFYIDPTITFDQQSGTGGTSSITGPWGAAMPSITLPKRAGKKFEGYYTGQNGTGTQYYAYNGNSVHTCDFTSNPTLYANWKTPTEYTFYYAAPSDIVADNTVKCYVNYGYDQGSADVNMTATNMTYNNKRIYSVTVTANYQSFDGIYFKPKGCSGDGSEEQAANTSYVAASEINGKIYEHGVGWQTYAEDASYTVYYVNTNNWTTPKAYAWSSDYDKSVADYASSAAMTKTDYTYNGHDIYTITYTRGFTNVIFNDNASESAKTDNLECYANRDKLYNGSTWQAYGRDVTVYTVPDYLFKDYTTKFSEETHYPSVCVQYGNSEWKTINMDKTDYTYDNYPIWKATFLLDYNIFKEFQIKYFDKANSQQVGLYQYNKGGNTEYPSSDLDDKLYHGWNGSSHDFFSYTYDVKLDQQDGSGGTESIKATDGVVLPAATMPGRDGYIFGGYYTVVGGNGDMYYDTNGNSSTQWNSRTITTLYAKWTAREYTVKLEDMEPTTAGQGSVSVMFDASDNMTSSVTQPTKTHYAFKGYWTDNNDSGATLGVQLIDEDGNWKAGVSPYTGSDADGNPTWIYPNGISLFAKWEEHPYTIALVVFPEGAGTIKIGEDVVGSVNAFISTKTNLITATPANPVWKFKEWQYSENVGPANGTGNDNTVQITATQNGTLTAVFESRYCLVGQLNDGSNEAGGMLGMDDYTVDFDFVSYTGLGEEGVELRCTRSLQPNKQYKFAIHDHVIGRNYGKNSGSDNPTLDAGESWELNTIDHDVLFNTSAAGEYTFKITHMTYGENGDYKCYYPTVEIVYPTAHQLELGWRYTLIDTPNELKEGDTGGTVTATSSGFSIKDKEYIADGEELQLTATSNTGYRFDDKWYNNNDCQNSFMSGNPTQATVKDYFRVYAKFAEIPTPITITKIGGGEVQINGEDKESTSVGVTTTRTLTAVAAAGYTFSGWTLPDNADFEMIEGDVKNSTITLRGKGAGDAGEIIANFTECWVLSAESDGWGNAEFTIANITVEDGKAIGYADIALPANTDLQFKVVDKSTSRAYKNGVDQVYYMTYGNSQDWSFGTDKTYNCGITTAGKGSYRFNWNFTDKTMTVVYPVSYQVNYGAAVGGSVTSVLDDDGKEIPNGGYVREGGSVTYEATASDGYTFTGWCPNDSYGDTFTDHNPWENSNVTATSNAYAKFHSTNFVIYRTGDKASDPRAVWDDVESYDGGTISETIEFRMKVNELDYWYTLCLPFEVNAVQVWDEVDGAYYDIVPYWRTEGKYYTGHYILRKPVTTTNYAIETFEKKWEDPDNSGVRPEKNIPYIIQWHDEYFQDKYISFLGAAGQEIPTAMDEGNYASSDETVNIYGNNSMTTGTVRDAYLLDPSYGTDGAWMREEIGTDRSVLPFECFIRANPATTAKYRVLRRDMADDTPTGLDTLSKTEDTVSKVLINNRIYIIRGGKMYTIQGTFVKEVE